MPAQNLTLEDAVSGHPAVLLDTCILIPEFNETPLPVRVLAAVPRAQRSTPVIALWEFLHGQAGSLVSVDLLRRRQRWLDTQDIRALAMPKAVSTTFRSLLDIRASPPSAVDCMIAAEAIHRRIPLVTRNVADFAGVPGLLLVPIK